jgi:hypothetical protein
MQCRLFPSRRLCLMTVLINTNVACIFLLFVNAVSTAP